MRYRSISTLLLIFGTGLLLSAQTAKTVIPEPNWRLGDKRQADVVSNVRIQVDTLVFNTKSVYSSVIEVTKAKKDGYELAVRSEEVESVEVKTLNEASQLQQLLDEVGASTERLVKAVTGPMSDWAFRYELDRTGKVLGRVEGKGEKEKLVNAMRQAWDNGFAEIARQGGGEPVKVSDAQIWFFVDSLYDSFLEVQANELQYFLKIYNTEFPLAGSLRKPVSIEDVQAPLYPGMPELPGMCETSLDKNDNNELVCRTVTTYDADPLYAYFERENPGTVPREGLFMDEESVEHFEKRSGWLTQATTAYRLRSAVMNVDGLVEVKLKPAR